MAAGFLDFEVWGHCTSLWEFGCPFWPSRPLPVVCAAHILYPLETPSWWDQSRIPLLCPSTPSISSTHPGVPDILYTYPYNQASLLSGIFLPDHLACPSGLAPDLWIYPDIPPPSGSCRNKHTFYVFDLKRADTHQHVHIHTHVLTFLDTCFIVIYISKCIRLHVTHMVMETYLFIDIPMYLFRHYVFSPALLYILTKICIAISADRYILYKE